VEHDLNLFSVEAKYGFMEEINITDLEPDLRRIVDVPPTRILYYMVGRESLICESRLNFLARIYRKLAGVSRPLAESLHLPAGQVLEIGTAIRI
jgi:K+ transporter